MKKKVCGKCNDTTFIETPAGFKRCECYLIEATNKQWLKFGVKTEDLKPLKEYKVNTDIRKKAVSEASIYIREFDNLGHDINICFMGQSGAGKTHLTTAIGANLFKSKKCLDMVYMPYVEVMKSLKALANDDALYKSEVEKYLTTKLLIIDDLFKDKTKNGKLIGELKETDIKHIYPIINHRYINNLPTIFSTECIPTMLFELDEALAGRILEKSRTVVFKYGKENNYRMRNIT